MAMVKRFEVYLVNLDPTIGSEIKKTRPALIISPDEMNLFLKTVIIAPMTSKERNYPTRHKITFMGKKGEVVLDQIRTIDKSRLIQKLGNLKEADSKSVSKILLSMFE